jgi:hypothetical protein
VAPWTSWTTPLINLVLAVVEGAFLLWVARRREIRWLPMAFPLVAAAAGISIFYVAGTGFYSLRLLADLVFVHCPLVLLVGAYIARRHPWARRAQLAQAAVLATIGVYAFLIEPKRLILTRYDIRSPKVARPFRIGVLADLQTDHVADHERRAVQALMRERPDVILLPGDYLQVEAGGWPRERDRLRAVLRETGFGAPIGAWAVDGNVDPPKWTEIFDGFGVHCVFRSERFETPGFTLTALALMDSFSTGPRITRSGKFHIVMGHAPNFALGSPPADLLIAGHTHGGQVRIPFVGPPIILSLIPHAWAAGRTELAGGGTLIVSRGVGMERGQAPRLRFNCPPEIVIIEVRPAGS